MKLFRKNKEDENNMVENDLTMTSFDDDDGTIPPPPPSSPPPSVSHYTSDGMDHVSIISSVKGQDQFQDNVHTVGSGEDAPFVSNVGDNDINNLDPSKHEANGYSQVPLRGHFRGMMNAQTFDEQDAGMDEIEVPSSSVVDRWNQWEEKYALRKRCRNYGMAIVGCVLVILAVILGSVFGTRSGKERSVPAHDTNNGGENGNEDGAPPTAGAGNFEGPAHLNSAAGRVIWNSPLLPESTKEDLENEEQDSAAYKAWQWIASDTNNDYAFETMGGTNAQLDLMQRYALATFYNSVDLEGFDGWMTEGDVCTWAGIVCDEAEASKVTNLKFPNDDIVGTLPPELIFLQDLQVIEMYGNQISGEIPDEIYSLPQLQIIDLQNNMISGPISPAVENAAGLVGLYLGRNLISGQIPLELFNLKSLVALWLDYNEEFERQNFPEEIGQLQNLEQLKLAEIKLVGNIPAAIGSLEQLRKCLLSFISFHSFLTYRISYLYDKLFYSQIEIFHAQGNGLDGEIPDIRNLKGLGENYYL